MVSATAALPALLRAIALRGPGPLDTTLRSTTRDLVSITTTSTRTRGRAPVVALSAEAAARIRRCHRRLRGRRPQRGAAAPDGALVVVCKRLGLSKMISARAPRALRRGRLIAAKCLILLHELAHQGLRRRLAARRVLGSALVHRRRPVSAYDTLLASSHLAQLVHGRAWAGSTSATAAWRRLRRCTGRTACRCRCLPFFHWWLFHWWSEHAAARQRYCACQGCSETREPNPATRHGRRTAMAPQALPCCSSPTWCAEKGRHRRLLKTELALQGCLLHLPVSYSRGQPVSFNQMLAKVVRAHRLAAEIALMLLPRHRGGWRASRRRAR